MIVTIQQIAKALNLDPAQIDPACADWKFLLTYPSDGTNTRYSDSAKQPEAVKDAAQIEVP